MELSAEQKQQLEEQKQHCPFCKIIRGEIPSQKVYEDEHVLAILDINPLKEGHVLLLPKEHYPIMALLPKDLFAHLGRLLPQMTKQLKQALVAKHVSVFVANGAAAGQQAGHFMIHLIPSDKPIPRFNPSLSEQEPQASQELHKVLAHNLPLMMQNNTQAYPLKEAAATPEATAASAEDDSRRLAELLEENPQFKELLINNPEAVKAGLQDNPSLKPLFNGVDVHALSKQLQQQTPSEPTKQPSKPETPAPTQQASNVPQATQMSDEELRVYLAEHKKLKHYLEHDQETLQAAIQQQPKLQAFFAQTTPQAVLARIQPPSDASLEDLAGGGST